MKPYNKCNIPLARDLRKNMTPWERKLWYNFLQNYPIRFQRQKCIGDYIADFYCAKARIVIELDGSRHYDDKTAINDSIRTNDLEKMNLKVIKIPNNQIDNSFYEVCEFIDKSVKKSLPQSALQTAPSSEGAKTQAGLYIHIPFCANKCPYCDFYSVKYEKKLAQNYAKRLTEEFEKYRDAEFDTVYFGGGTPSILEPQLIGNILNSARKAFKIDSHSEITIECNPSKNLEADFRKYADYGINRISLGMQSAVKSERLALGRRAGKEEVAKAIFDAKNAGITNISLDLMLGTPKQTLEGLNETFAFIKEMDVTHISAYMLKIEENTPFYKLQNKLDLPDEDCVSDMYLKTVDTLSAIGFYQYEISNFAKPNYESRHNTKYWRLIPYLGIGKSAHSFWNGRRFYYDKDFNIIDDGAGGSEEEQIMLGLRLSKGIKKSLIKRDLTPYINADYMKENGENISFTPKGFLVSNTIISKLI